MSKKLFLSLLPLLALSLAGCQRGNGGASNPPTSDESEEEESEEESSEEGSDDESSDDDSSGGGETGVTYTITTTQDWVFGTAGVPIFAHYWDGSNPGEWAVVDYEVGEMTATFVIPSDVEATGFLVVRCSEGTALEDGKYPNWTITTGDEPGRIYNKTESNVDITDGVTSYNIPNMENYPSA